jgi:hypothetical protein
MTNMTNSSTKIATAISILSMIAVVESTASVTVQGQLSVEPQPQNMTSSATNMTSLNITATGANTTTAVTNATAGFFCYNCLNITATTGANTTTAVTNATAANSTTTTNATSTKQQAG